MNSPVSSVVLVCTVGGTPAPLRKSISFHKPTHVIYLASPESRTTIRSSIEEGLNWQIGDTQTVTLANYQDIVQCVKDMRKGIADSLHAMSLPEDTHLITDITGGTKIMSAALALVMMEFNCRFSYVGGGVRNKDGLGVVESGTESVVMDANPWDVLALREVRALARSFNHAQFADALTIAQSLSENIDDPDRKKFYAALKDMVEGYGLWDAFDHKKAQSILCRAENRLAPYAIGNIRLTGLLDALKKDLARLDILLRDVEFLTGRGTQLDDAGRAYLLDLISNARRCADSGHYDDAVARLYSALEKCAKTALQLRYNIDNSHLLPEQIPESLREEFCLLADANGEVRIGLEKSFQLLYALNDPLGMAYHERQTTLKAVLQSRNSSLLAHGYVPVGKDKYTKLFTVVLDFLQVDAEKLPVFPMVDWKALMP